MATRQDNIPPIPQWLYDYAVSGPDTAQSAMIRQRHNIPTIPNYRPDRTVKGLTLEDIKRRQGDI